MSTRSPLLNGGYKEAFGDVSKLNDEIRIILSQIRNSGILDKKSLDVADYAISNLPDYKNEYDICHIRHKVQYIAHILLLKVKSNDDTENGTFRTTISKTNKITKILADAETDECMMKDMIKKNLNVNSNVGIKNALIQIKGSYDAVIRGVFDKTLDIIDEEGIETIDTDGMINAIYTANVNEEEAAANRRDHHRTIKIIKEHIQNLPI